MHDIDPGPDLNPRLVSMIVVVKDAGEDFTACVAALLAQQLDSADSEVILVDSGSNDEGTRRIRELQDHNPDNIRVFENPAGRSGFTQTGADIPAGTLSLTLDIAVHMHDFVNALYVVQACNALRCTNSTGISAMNVMLDTIGRFKGSNAKIGDQFGYAVALSADGRTMAVGATRASENIGIGSVYLFRFDGTDWFEQAYVEASNGHSGNSFGEAVALSADGDTLFVGAPRDNGNSQTDSGAVYVFQFDGTDWNEQAYIQAPNQIANSHFGSAVALSADSNVLAVGSSGGAVSVFNFDGADWVQQAILIASNADDDDWFGWAVALSADGNTLAVGARREDSPATGIGGSQGDDLSSSNSGAAYIFRSVGTGWFQQAYVKASDTKEDDEFGFSVTLSGDGNTLAVGTRLAGAVYLFRFDDTKWSQHAYVSEPANGFGNAVALSVDGDTLVVGARWESTHGGGVSSNQNKTSLALSGAAYLFRFDGTDWLLQTFIKSTLGREKDSIFGHAIALSGDGNTLAVGAPAQGANVDYGSGTVFLY